MPNPHVNEKPTNSIALSVEEHRLLELSLSVFQTKEVLRDHVSSFGMARSWIIRNQDALKCGRSAYLKALEWKGKVAEIEAERQTILNSVQKALAITGKIVFDLPTEHGTQIIDELIAVEQIIDHMLYARLSDWRFLAEQRFGTEEVLMAAVEKMNRLVRAIGVVIDGMHQVTPDERLVAMLDEQETMPETWRAKALAEHSEEHLSIENAAGCIGMSARTIYRMMDDGMPYTQPTGKPKAHRRIRKSDLLAWARGTHPDFSKTLLA